LGNPSLDASYGFTPFMNMWGWATWADRAAMIDYENSAPCGLLENASLFLALQRGRPHFWHLDYRWFLHWRKSFRENATGVTNFWGLQWIYCGLMLGKISIFPSSNLISNIGFGDQGTATTDGNSCLAALPSEPLGFPLVHPTTVRYSKSYELECIRRKWSGYSPSFIQDLRTMYYYTKLAFLRVTGNQENGNKHVE
jgi:hypothetical protein